MTNPITIRSAEQADINALAAIADQTLFPGDMLADMISPFFSGAEDQCWAVAATGNDILGFAYAAIEEMTDQTWNLKAIATDPRKRRLGAGRALIRHLEGTLDARVVVIDTTQLEDQAAGRALYAACGYGQSCTIPDFWETGVDKVTFAKRLR